MKFKSSNEFSNSTDFFSRVKITEFTYKGFRTFLLYLYTDRIEPTPQVAGDAIGKTLAASDAETL